MGTMTKLRENTGVILWILVVAFGVIWVLQDSGGLDFVGTAGGTNVIVVDGDPISVEEYTRAVDAQVQRYQQQTGESMPPQMLERERERVFEALVEDRLLEREMNRLGIIVTEDEVYEMVFGDRPHPIILAYFGDGEGGVNRALLQNFLENPEARQDWIQIESYLIQERRREKLQNLLAASVRVTDQDIRDEYMRRNRSATVDWVGLRYADVPDEEVEVADRDLRRFYDANREEFRRERTYTLDYVSITKMPSEEDSLLIVNEMDAMRQEFAEADDDSLFLARHVSDRSYTSAWFRADEIEPELAAAVFDDPSAGDVVGPVFAGGNVHLVKIQNVRPADEEVIRARHILLRSPSEDPDVEGRLQNILRQIQDGADFADMARMHSEDNTSGQGGDLGWFGRGRMVDPFENAAFGASVGDVVGPVRTTFGYHLIQVTARANQELQMADYARSITADIGTLNRIQERLEDLRYFTEEGADFREEAQRMNMPVESVQVEANQEVIPGIGESRAVARFLEGAGRNDLSEVIELDDAFIVASVRNVQREGYRSLDEVRDEIRPRVVLERKKEIQLQRLRAAANDGDLSAIASALGTTVRTQENVTFASQVVPGLGREPRFAGAAFGLDEGETSGTIEGRNAAFVIHVRNVQEPVPLTDGERDRIREQLLNQRRSQVMNQWIASLREEARVDDYRRRLLQY